MKKVILVWASCLVVVYVFGMLHKALLGDFPVTGAVTIQNTTAAYRFPKEEDAGSVFRIGVRCEARDLQGILLWHTNGDSLKASPNRRVLTYDNGMLSTEFPEQPIGAQIFYKIKLLSINDEIKEIPESGEAAVTFRGKVPASIAVTFMLLLYAGILLSLRGAFEFFSETPHPKRWILFTLTAFLLHGVLFAPVRAVYLAGSVGTASIPFAEEFALNPLMYSAIWISVLIIAFNTRYAKLSGLLGAAVTLLWFLFGTFITAP